MGVFRARDCDRVPEPMPPPIEVIAEIVMEGFDVEVDEQGLITITPQEPMEEGHRLREIVNAHAKRLRAAMDWEEFCNRRKDA